jgi:hypothetical protein
MKNRLKVLRAESQRPQSGGAARFEGPRSTVKAT